MKYKYDIGIILYYSRINKIRTKKTIRQLRQS